MSIQGAIYCENCNTRLLHHPTIGWCCPDFYCHLFKIKQG